MRQILAKRNSRIKQSTSEYIQNVVRGVFEFTEAVVLPSLVELPQDLVMRFSLRELNSFRAGVFRSPTMGHYEVYLTSGMAAEIYAALCSLPAKEKRFLRRQLTKFHPSRTHDFQTGFIFAGALAFVVSHELSHALAGHVDLFRANQQKNQESLFKIKEIEADGLALFLNHHFRQELAVSCIPGEMEGEPAWPQGFDEEDSQELHRLGLFGILILTVLLERHHLESDQRKERPGFTHARLIYFCVGHILLERPDLAHFDHSGYRIVFDVNDRQKLTEYFALHVLPVLICCQRVADAAGVDLHIVPIGKKKNNDSVSLVADIAAIVSGQNPGSSAGGEQLARLGHDLASWYGKVRPHRKVKTTI